MESTIDCSRAMERLLRLLAVPGTPGEETAVRDFLVEELVTIGVPREAIREDDAPTWIDLQSRCGNLIADLPGNRPAPRLLLSAHMDTVPLAHGAQPVRRGDRIVAEGRTALGGDDRTGVAAVLAAVDELIRQGMPCPPLTMVFTVHEESGARGARALRSEDLADVTAGFNFDGRDPAAVTIGAIGKSQMDIEIRGIASHASVHPERGVSAVTIFAGATAQLERDGWLGAIDRSEGQGRSNIGVVQGGDATNVVTDRLFARAEARSHDPSFLKRILDEFRVAFSHAAAGRTNATGNAGEATVSVVECYPPFRLDEHSTVVETAVEAIRRIGLTPNVGVTDGGGDANWLVRHSIPTVTLGAGAHRAHTVDEYVVIDEFLAACRLALEILRSWM